MSVLCHKKNPQTTPHKVQQMEMFAQVEKKLNTTKIIKTHQTQHNKSCELLKYNTTTKNTSVGLQQYNKRWAGHNYNERKKKLCKTDKEY